MDKQLIRYSKEHLWVIKKEDTVLIGLSSYALQQLGQVVFLNLPKVGEWFAKGEICGDIESVKNVSDLIVPVDGEVAAVNAALQDAPEILNDNMESSWLLEIKAEVCMQDLMDEAAYQEYVGQL